MQHQNRVTHKKTLAPLVPVAFTKLTQTTSQSAVDPTIRVGGSNVPGTSRYEWFWRINAACHTDKSYGLRFAS